MAEDNDKKIMRGEFRGDFTRDTFDPMKAFSRVLMQQGRVQVDADWNEQVSILLHYMRNFNQDMGGPHWGPKEGEGFKITKNGTSKNDFSIGAGHYYVNGLLCEVDEQYTYKKQPNYPLPSSGTFEEDKYLVYLDVWERHVSYIEDNIIREVALGGADTASRAQVVCQVKVTPYSPVAGSEAKFKTDYNAFIEFLKNKEGKDITQSGSGTMLAKIKDKSEDINSPCLVAPESHYRGTENQLYRVEIHKPGNSTEATFKWSRENASVIFPITKIEGENIILEHLGRDSRYGLKVGNWVEIVDDDSVLCGKSGNLVRIIDVDRENLMVTVVGSVSTYDNPEAYKTKHVILRRWDQSKGSDTGISVENENEIDLENGIQVKFSLQDKKEYKTGDYWLIPARTATGNIEWPLDGNDKPKKLLPHGIVHHYAPLAVINVANDGKITDNLTDLRQIFSGINQ